MTRKQKGGKEHHHNVKLPGIQSHRQGGRRGGCKWTAATPLYPAEPRGPDVGCLVMELQREIVIIVDMVIVRTVGDCFHDCFHDYFHDYFLDYFLDYFHDYFHDYLHDYFHDYFNDYLHDYFHDCRQYHEDIQEVAGISLQSCYKGRE